MRIRLCSDGPEEVCEPLSTQVQDVKAANPDKFCSAFGLGFLVSYSPLANHSFTSASDRACCKQDTVTQSTTCA